MRRICPGCDQAFVGNDPDQVWAYIEHLEDHLSEVETDD